MAATIPEITAIVERLVTLASQDAELKNQLRRLAQAVLELIEDQTDEHAIQGSVPVPIAEQMETTIEQIEVAVASVEDTVEASVAREPLPELTLGRSVATELPQVAYPALTRVSVDLDVIEQRCRLKAEACRWAATRRRKMAEGARFDTDIDPKDREIIARAKDLPDCFLWMCHPDGPNPLNPALYNEVAGCFDAVAEAISLIRQVRDSDADQCEFESALDLLAEAQSALRVSIGKVEGPTDSDQDQVFDWLRRTTSERQILIKKYMRIDDPADSTNWDDIVNRIELVTVRVQETKKRRSQRSRLMGKVRHKAGVILNEPGKAASEWPLLISTVCELISDGVSPSNRELREQLLPVVDLLPEMDSCPQEFEWVLGEIDRYLATVPPPESSVVARPIEEVRQAARLLRGKSMVLIGGDKRMGAYQAIKEVFGLKELIWIETRAHESYESFGPYIAGSDVAVVLLAIRWSSHSYGEVKNFCDRYGKPLVRLPGGYNSNQIATQILAQASERLRISQAKEKVDGSIPS